MTRTDQTRASYRKRLTETLGADTVAELTWQDFRLVHERLGWCEGTYRTWLKYEGRSTGDLSQGPRDYYATDAELETLKTILPESLVVTLAVTGCRFGELWRMKLRSGYLIIRTQKNGREVKHDTAGLAPAVKRLILLWVERDMGMLKVGAAAKRWRRALDNGTLPKGCTSHAFRYRAATKLAEAGADICEIADYLGHRSLDTTRGYVSRNTMSRIGTKVLL